MTALEIPAGAREIRLGGKKAAGRVALVDAADYETVSAYPWHVLEILTPGRRPNGPYAITSSDAAPSQYMHKLITGYARTDHANHNTLDNRRKNLRSASPGQNGANSRKALNCASRYKGVAWHASNCNWIAAIRIDGRRIYLGSFANETEAARTYDAAAVATWGEYAHLNFPAVEDGLTEAQAQALYMIASADAWPSAVETPEQRVERILCPALTLSRTAEQVPA